MVLNLLCNRCTGRGFEAAASTKNRRARRLLMGAKWDRLALKDKSCARHDTTVIGSIRIVANDNYAEVALAA